MFFIHIQRWNGRLIWAGGVVWREVGRSLAAFMCGAVAYLLAQPFLRQVGFRSPELQVSLWFGVTVVGVAVISGRFVSWRPTEQVLAVAVAVGIGWLVIRT